MRERYAEPSNTKHLVALYDPYVKAIRQASDRVMEQPEGGIVAFVTNGGFIDSNAFDGFRKALAEEFHAIYCFNLRGDQRTSGERPSRKAATIFGSGSRAGVAILLLVKKPGDSPGATIYYHDIGDYLRPRAEAGETGRFQTGDLPTGRPSHPTATGDWINQRSDTFPTLRPLTSDANGTQAPLDWRPCSTSGR